MGGNQRSPAPNVDPTFAKIQSSCLKLVFRFRRFATWIQREPQSHIWYSSFPGPAQWLVELPRSSQAKSQSLWHDHNQIALASLVFRFMKLLFYLKTKLRHAGFERKHWPWLCWTRIWAATGDLPQWMCLETTFCILWQTLSEAFRGEEITLSLQLMILSYS